MVGRLDLVVIELLLGVARGRMARLRQLQHAIHRNAC
jgi:hypothetical protein